MKVIFLGSITPALWKASGFRFLEAFLQLAYLGEGALDSNRTLTGPLLGAATIWDLRLFKPPLRAPTRVISRKTRPNYKSMSQNPVLTNGPQPKASGPLLTASALLSALTQEDHQQLLAFARRRLDRSMLRPHLQRLLNSTTPEDLVHSALEKILLGDIDATKGRRLNPQHRWSTAAFMRGVMSVINSHLSNLATSAEASSPHMQVGETESKVDGVQLIEPLDLISLLQCRDLQQVLFARLRQVADLKLQPIIDYWEPRFLDEDCIAYRQFDRRLVHRVRVLARSIVSQLDEVTIYEKRPGEPANSVTSKEN